ncbi:hypothetical protein ABEY01_14225 [Bacillus velezensis]|uniref:hypothetical protein n=1 Tax=Bacillus TaxID=1386 RepID=UPI000987D98E|nr:MULTISPECIES: hypothetical protein [Bacillus]AQS45361.1 hypothetical protein BVH55_16300 [Bacillus velezensis]AUJ60100.1 hypothetical protein B6257_05610 [Bacillus velezensis]MBD8888971.1 hypothetical protein [Bacillus velezensis]MBI0440665.1 hypothetical protein [Bacillus velezensis]MBT0954905.1 hypothetical protein [Bacillus velezensis]
MYPNYYYPYFGESRAFEGLIGQFHTLLFNLTLPNGRLLTAGTRVFIHRSEYTPAGQEFVTIVFPLSIGGNCIAGSAVVSASQLTPGGIQTVR